MIHISTEATVYTTSRIYASYLQGLPIYTWSRKCNPLQYSCLKISMDRGAWQAIQCVRLQIDMTEQLSTQTYSHH